MTALERYQADFWHDKYNKAMEENERLHFHLKRLEKAEESNQVLVGRVMEMEVLLSFIRRVGDGLHIDHEMLQRTYRLFPDMKRFFKPLKSRYSNE